MQYTQIMQVMNAVDLHGYFDDGDPVRVLRDIGSAFLDAEFLFLDPVFSKSDEFVTNWFC